MSKKDKVFRSFHRPSEAELSEAEQWAKETFLNSACPPFRFIYDGKQSSELLKGWDRICQNKQLPGKGAEYIITYTDPKTKLQLTCQTVVFDDYPAVEWILYFHNASVQDSPILEDIQALDMTISRDVREDILYPNNEFLLHKWRGCLCAPEDYAPSIEVLPAGWKTRLFSLGGRSASGRDTPGHGLSQRSDGSLPFFNVQAINKGLIIALGWTGQWLANFERIGQTDLNISAGMELTHLKLLPGETIRSPRVLTFFWQENRIAAHNKFRQFMLDHHTPKKDGQPTNTFLAGCGWQHFNYGNDVTEDNQIEFVRRYAERKIPLEYFWVDAGWYGTKGHWGEDVGNWVPKKAAFPRGLKPVADEVHKLGMGFFLWFELERACPDTPMYNEHPEWLFMPTKEMVRRDALLNLGNPEAWAWAVDFLSNMINEVGLDVYRLDINMDLLDFWRNADTPDRQGISEIRYIEGLYALWDELLKRHPGLIIDNNSTGNRRLDLETISRSIGMTRSDHSEPAAVQSHGYALSFFISTLAGTCQYFDRIDSYVFRSGLANGMVLDWDVQNPDFDQPQAMKNIEEFKMVRPLYYGDFYPLTGYSCSHDTWLAYQLHRQDLHRGAVLVFRRPASPYETAKFKLSGLKEDTNYELTDADNGSKRILTGKELMIGIMFILPKPETSQLITYLEMN